MIRIINRRRFLAHSTLLSAGPLLAQQAPRPNILWLTSEDNGPHLGAYGDSYADTPNLDRLASQGMLYRNAWSNAPVCAPARTTIISGLYPTCTGAEHMRSMVALPPGMRMFPQYLREAGYYCTNNSKEDYNLEAPGQVWDESSRNAHWRKRRPGQPFFAVFNFTTTHESQIRSRPHQPVHDPARVPLPEYHPDTPEVRQDWAQYHDKLTEMDRQAAEVLAQLEDDGLREDTVIFYYADHGPGMPRCKRWPYNSGLRVPMVVWIPEKYRHLAPAEYRPGAQSDRLVGFIDLAPTVLSLAGLRPPDHFQGGAFLGAHQAAEPPYLYGFRGRMDERYDMVRSVRDRRYVYIRNYMPHKVYGQYLDYMFQTPTTRVWKQLYDQGKLEVPRTHFWETKPPEELYDLASDPDEVRNLAGSPAHQAILQRLRGAEQAWVREVRDVGFLPEDEIHVRSQGRTPYQAGRADSLYPAERVMKAARLASGRDSDTGELVALLADSDSGVRYWAATGLLIRGQEGVAASAEPLRRALGDPSPSVRCVAAEALGKFGSASDLEASLSALIDLAPLDRNSVFVSILALNAIDALGEKAAALREKVAVLPREKAGTHERLQSYVPRLIERITASPN